MIFAMRPSPVRLKSKALIDFCAQPLLIFFLCRGTSGSFLWRENAPLLRPAPRGMNLRILFATRCYEDNSKLIYSIIITYHIYDHWSGTLDVEWVLPEWRHWTSSNQTLLRLTQVDSVNILTFCPLFQSRNRTILPINPNNCPTASSPQRRLEKF